MMGLPPPSFSLPHLSRPACPCRFLCCSHSTATSQQLIQYTSMTFLNRPIYISEWKHIDDREPWDRNRQDVSNCHVSYVLLYRRSLHSGIAGVRFDTHEAHGVMYLSLYNTAMHNKMKFCKLLHATQTTKHKNSYTYGNIDTHVVHLLNLPQGVCKQQQQDGDDSVVSIFISKVMGEGRRGWYAALFWSSMAVLNSDC